MSGQQKTWCVLVALLAGSLPGQVQGGGEAKTGPKPLPPDVVKAWTATGLEVGWMDASRGRLDFTYPHDHAPADAVPAFSLWAALREVGLRADNRLAKLPDPGTRYGLSLRQLNVTDEGLKELAGLKSLQMLDLSYTNVTSVGLKELA